MKVVFTKLPYLFLLVFFSNVNEAVSQDRRFDNIRNSEQYIWGYAESDDYDEANKEALDDLITKISVHVESAFEYIAKESNDEINKYATSVIKTYSSTTLTDTKELYYERKGTNYLLRYIEADDLSKIFEQRKNKIFDHIHLGKKAKNKNEISAALRYYYWAYALYLSHPYHAEMEINDEGHEVLVGLFLDYEIKSLLSQISFKVKDKVKFTKENRSKVIMECSFNSLPVENLDFRYNSGGKKSAMHEVYDGIAEVYLYGEEQYEIDKLNLKIEYKYKNKCSHDKELLSVVNTVKVPYFKNASISINLPSSVNKIKAKKVIVPSFESLNKIEKSGINYSKSVKDLLILIAEKEYTLAYKYFTDEGKDMFKKLIQYGDVSLSPMNDTLKIIQLNNETIVRSVPMSFNFPNSRKQFRENVVFTFNEENKINAISFAVSDNTIADIVNHSERFGNIKDKYTLIKFMEFYKTAYSLKRLDYIESIFSDNALIIVGTVLKKSKPLDDGSYKSIGDKQVKYQRYSKKDYIERLNNVFTTKEYINIDFDEAIVKKQNGSGKIYGIQIAQNYYSDNYSDFGYLFLMIDLNDSLNPTIYVRTWQPQKNSDGSIYGLEDFRMN